MRTHSALYLLLLLTCLLFATSKTLQNTNQTCDASPSTILFEKYIQNHPYWNANFGRDKNYWATVLQQTLGLGYFGFYKMGSALGSGRFSHVFKAVHTPTKNEVAIKQFAHSEKYPIMKEIQILRMLKDAPNFLPIRDILKEGDYQNIRISLVFDLFESKHYKEFFPDLTKYQIKRLMYETYKTLDYAHRKGIMHRDIKPHNVLMDPVSLKVRIIDWGMSDYYLPSFEYNARVSSFHYKAPELLLNKTTHDYAIDVWSAGCILAEMSFKKIHFFKEESATVDGEDPSIDPVKSFKEHLDATAKMLGTLKLKQYADKVKDSITMEMMNGIGDYKKVQFTELINEANSHLVDELLIDLLEKIFVYDPAKRITTRAVLQHPYFDEVRKVDSD